MFSEESHHCASDEDCAYRCPTAAVKVHSIVREHPVDRRSRVDKY